MRAVVLALTVALVACHQINLVPDFTADKTYVYKYEGLLLGGLPQEGLGKAGIKVSCKVFLRAAEKNTFLLKLEDPQLFEYTGVWPQDSFVPATKLTSALSAQLKTPIKFEYSNGAVGRIFAPAGVSATVLNLHRGILNILQLNLKNTQNVYELHEAGPHGVCKTHYMISEDEKTHEISVTKSRDLTNCHERIIKDIGLAYAEKCDECQQRRQSLTGTATYSYTMKPTDAGALVSEATVEELHQFSLFNTITGAAQMRAKQTLTLLEVQNSPIAPISAEYLARGSLKYEFATEILQTPIQLLKINNAEAQIGQVLQHLVANNVPAAHEDAPLKFVQLVQLMRVATYENINNIWDQNKNKPVHRRWILDAAPAVGTSVALRFIKDKFLADEFTTTELTQALLAGLHMATADRDVIQEVASLAMNPKVKAIPVLREMIMLGYGSMIAKYCAEVPSCPADFMKPVHEHAAEAIARSDIPEITLALKVMGNAGHPASIKHIMKFLPGFGSAAAAMPMIVHDDAIMALRNIAKKEPKMVQPVALQLFMDKTLHPEVRMIACIVLFETKPSVALMSTIANAMDKEPSMQVASFAYSHIKSLTRSMAPDYENVAAAANVAYRILSPKLDRLSSRFSSAFHMDLYLSPLMVGAAGSAYIINDAATILPRAVVTKARAYLAGAAADVLEVGVRTEGLQEALQRTASDENVNYNTKIKRTMKALMDWKSMPTNKYLASFYIKVLGQDIAYANIDKAYVDYIIQQATQAARPRARELLKEAVKALQGGISFQYSKSVLAAEVRRIIPTGVGMPMELSVYTAAVAAAAVNVKAAITPSLPENPETATLDHLMKTDFQLQAEARPSVAMQTFAVIGVNTALIQAAVMARGKIHTVVPGKVAARADLPRGNFKIEILPSTDPGNVAAVSFETVAVARNIEDLPSEREVSLAPPAPSETKTLIPSSIQKSLCGVTPYCHIKGCLEVASRHAGFMGYNPLYYIIGQHSARVSFGRGDGPALERLEFEVRVGPEAAKTVVKDISHGKSESQEENIILSKLRNILESGLKNMNSFSSSSRSSRSSNSSDSSRSSISSKSSNSSSSSRHSRNSSSSSRSSMSASSSSRSSSSSSAHVSRVTNTYGSFKKFHNNQYLTSQESSNSSSESSTEVHQRWAKYLADDIPPALVIIARAVRSDRSRGYQFAAYLDKPSRRVQIVFSSLTDSDKWKLCADGVLSSEYKVAANFAWGEECRDYLANVKAETGLHESNPAARLKVEWNRVPRLLTLVSIYAKRVCSYLPLYPAAHLAGISVSRAQNKRNEAAVILSLSDERSLNIIVRAPKMTLSKRDMPLPIALPIEKDGSIPALKKWKNIREAIQNLDIQATIQNMDIKAILDELQNYDENLLDDIEKQWNEFVQKLDIRTITQDYISDIIEKFLNDFQALS